MSARLLALGFLCLGVLATGRAVAAEPPEVEELLRRFDHEPSIEELCRAAAVVAQVHPEIGASWLRRAGKAATLPTLRLRLERGIGSDASLSTQQTYDRSSISTGDDFVYEVGLTWHLDRLVFDPDELHAGREARRATTLRHEIQTQLVRLYFERRRLQVDALLDPGDTKTALLRALRIRELGAMIDALTGGRLSRPARRPAAGHD